MIQNDNQHTGSRERDTELDKEAMRDEDVTACEENEDNLTGVATEGRKRWMIYSRNLMISTTAIYAACRVR